MADRCSQRKDGKSEKIFLLLQSASWTVTEVLMKPLLPHTHTHTYNACTQMNVHRDVRTDGTDVH